MLFTFVLPDPSPTTLVTAGGEVKLRESFRSVCHQLMRELVELVSYGFLQDASVSVKEEVVTIIGHFPAHSAL